MCQESNESYSFSGSEAEEQNGTLTCAAAAINCANGIPLPPAVEIPTRVLQILYSTAQIFLGVLLNLLVIYAVLKYKKLRTIPFYIAIQIAVADLVLCASHGLPIIVNFIAGEWILGSEVCAFSGFTLFMMTSVRCLLVFSFSFERIIAVFAPFLYSQRKKKLFFVVCSSAWIVSLLISVLGIPQIFDCYSLSEPTLSCTIVTRCGWICNTYLYICVYVLIVPAIVLSGVFTLALYIKGRRIRKRESANMGLDHSNVPSNDSKALKTFGLLIVAILGVTLIPNLCYSLSALFDTLGQTLLVQI